MLRFKNLDLMTSGFGLFVAEAKRIIELKSLESYTIEIEISKRCKRAAGNIKAKNKYVKINVSYDYYKEFGIERSLGTLRHELAHLIAFVKLGFMDHGNLFKSICTELGGTMNAKMAGEKHASSACEQYIRGSIKNYKYVYSCPNCDNKIERSRKISEPIKRKICGRCRTSVRLWTETYITL